MKEFIEKLIGRLEEKANQTWLVLAERNGYERAIEIVNQLEEEYNNGWIPCSERLPEKYKPVLVLLNNKEMCVFTLETDFEDNNIMYWEDWYGYHKKISETIAWQPLPAPYQSKGE